MKNKHLWLALGEGLLFMILFLHRYELEWMCWVQMLICSFALLLVSKFWIICVRFMKIEE